MLDTHTRTHTHIHTPTHTPRAHTGTHTRTRTLTSTNSCNFLWTLLNQQEFSVDYVTLSEAKRSLIRLIVFIRLRRPIINRMNESQELAYAACSKEFMRVTCIPRMKTT